MDLKSSVVELPKVGPFFARKLEKLDIFTIEDLIYHAPTRYMDYSKLSKIANARVGETVTIHAKIKSLANVYSKRGINMQIGTIEDKTGKITVVWFNQPFLVKTLYSGRNISLSGKVVFFNQKLCLTSPDYEFLESENKKTLHTGRLVPIYRETAGISSKWIRSLIQKSDLDNIVGNNDFLPKQTRKKYNLIDFKTAIKYVHRPNSLNEVNKGIKRLAFNELLFLHLKSVYRKNKWRKNKITNRVIVDKIEIKKFINSLPYKLTSSQEKACEEILKDISSDIPMNRLLEGDVGSGKTVVSAIGAFAVYLNGFQTVIMTPTQILAQQHYRTLKSLLDKYNLRISLLTSSVKKIEFGRSDIFVGTHALIHKKINFDKVAFVVIDEQHRFGVEQRAHLIKKSGKNSFTPHVLTMTATPIPRTIALTSYGDLDLSILTELPKGRKKILTWVVPNQKRQKAYEWIKSQISSFKSQVFWICPLIEESEKETMQDVKAVTTEFQKMQSTFQNLKLGLLHGRMRTQEKNAILDKFREGEIDILVSTPVVEVGIDIPNATVMVIEAAERFGLAQLHQLRGRVGRGNKKSYCLLFSNFTSGLAYRRLTAMEKTYSGFELAELDLKLRGPGDIFGTRQSGFANLKIASWSNHQLIKDTKDVADEIFKNPQNFRRLTSDLEKYANIG